MGMGMRTASGSGTAGRTWGLGVGTSYTSGTVTYQGTGTNSSKVSWTEANKTLTVTLGPQASGSLAKGTQAAAPPSYTPSAGMRDIAGNSFATATFTSTGTSRF